MSLIYYIRLNTHSTAISAWEHLIQYVRDDPTPAIAVTILFN